MRHLLFPVLLCALGCNPAPSSDADTAVVARAQLGEREYELTDVPGTAAQRAVARDPLGNVIEEGFVENGVKQGCWVTYGMDSRIPERITNYLDGALNGPYLESDGYGRITKVANYLANALHGTYQEYRSNNPVKTATYKMGQLDGVLTEYDYRTGKAKQEVHYRDGVLEGPLRYYNEEGQIMAEWTYRNGERVEED